MASDDDVVATSRGEININETKSFLDLDFNGVFNVCFQRGTNYLQSRGLWHNNNPFNYVLPVTLIQIFLFVLASRIVYFVLRPLRTPKFICSLLAGILMGPSALCRSKTLRELLYPQRQVDIFFVVSSLGIIYSVFIVAMKMDVSMHLKYAKKTWRFGLIPVLANFFVVYILFYILPDALSSKHHPNFKNFNFIRTDIFLTTSLTSFPVISESLIELNLITSEIGQIALSSSMVNEILRWITVVLATFMYNRNNKKSLEFVSSYILFVLLCIFGVRPMALRISRSTPIGKPVKESHVVMIFLMVLIGSFMSDVLGLSFLQGPLIMGLVMPNTPTLANTIEKRLEAIVSEFLLPFFYVCVGVKFNVFSIDNWGIIFKFQIILLAGFLAKILACMLVSRTYQMKLKHGLVLGLMLNIKGMIDIIIFARMRRLKLLDDQVFSHLVLSCMVVSAIASPLIEILYNPNSSSQSFHKLSRKMVLNIQSTPRNRQLNIISCVNNEGEVRSIISLLEAFSPSYSNPICVYAIHLIELLGQSVPILRFIDIHKKKPWLLNYPNTNHIMQAFHNFSHNFNQSHDDDVLTIVPCINIAPYKTMHHSICNMARDKLVPLIILPFHDNVIHGNNNCNASIIGDVNANFLANAPCSVGLLVDKYSRLGFNRTSSFSSSSFSSFASSFHVGIFFIGGADDRECLALAMRMSEHKNIGMVLFRFIEKKEEVSKEEEVENSLDEGMIDEFMAMKLNDNNGGMILMEEIMVDGGEKLFEWIRRCEGNYNLVMVGKKHNMGCFNDEEMSNFIENVERLGMVGDMLASTEFCDGKVPVLVVQYGKEKE